MQKFKDKEKRWNKDKSFFSTKILISISWYLLLLSFGFHNRIQ